MQGTETAASSAPAASKPSETSGRYYCAGDACPGLPWPASQLAHPSTCVSSFRSAKPVPVHELPRDARREAIARLAAVSLSDHVIEELRPGAEWWIHKPGTKYQAYIVAVFHEGLVVAGDVGTLVFRIYDRAPLAFVRDHAHSTDYLMSKSVRAERVFLPGQARLVLDHWETHGGSDKARAVRTWWVGRVCTQEAWHEAYDLHGDGYDAPPCEDWDDEALWCLEALRRFVELFAAQLQRAEVEAAMSGGQP